MEPDKTILLDNQGKIADTLDKTTLLDNLGKIAYTLDRAYLSRLTRDYGVLCFNEKYNQNSLVTVESNIRVIRVLRWVYDKEENPGECFKNVLSTFSDGDHTLALIVKRKRHKVEMYFVVKNEGAIRGEDSENNAKLLEYSLKGNFPGTSVEILDVKVAKNVVDFSKNKSITVLSNIPSEFSKDYITQGLDKVLNGIVPADRSEEYSVVFLAESLAQTEIRDIISGYEEIATSITPFAQYQFQAGTNEVKTKGETETFSQTESITNSVYKTHSVNIGASGGISHGDSVSKSYNIGAVIGAIVGPVAAGAGSVIAGPVGGFVAGRLANAVCNAIPTKTEAEQNGANIGGSLGYGYGWGSSKATTTADGKTTGFSNSVSIGESKTTSYNYKSYMVSDLVNRLEKSIKRVEEGQGTGLWKYAVYVISNEAKVSENVASSLMSITQGNESYLEPSYIQNWFFEKSNGITPFSELTKYISSFTHPVFISLDGTMAVTPTSYISTKDLAHVVTFPKKSLQGMPVLQGVQFGREPNSLAQTNERISLGNAYHMFEEVPNVSINISKDSLSSHTFITGSTGTGKSNTIYHILNELCPENGDTHFLVIEPAKGEYKRVFGKRKDVNVYGTNPDLTPLLHINPFSFPVGKIHIYEHLDRLVEIFNVCWPMYAAMPAVLKEAIERAYLAAGWDLKTSKNRYNKNLFPSFCDVLSEIENVIDNSQYSSDSKGDYKGALLTRVRSLTNGINGLIFSSEEQTDEQLFDKNVIIDLSRVGAVETTSLIMGIIVMKLQEYRMAQGKTNAKLCHVTVLEEAHNILKKTSMEQSSESSNIAGKSVEMLTNAIAEMRTYGEGFIIADQAPCLLDEAVIRNTNTKIVLRIPDYADRKLVGKSMGMNDNQIDEIARMENYVAAVYQSGWLEPVLCKVTAANVSKEEYSLEQKEQPTSLKTELIRRLQEKKLNKLIDKKDEEKIATSDLSIKAKRFLFEYIKDDAEIYRLAAGIAYEVLDGASIMTAINRENSFEEQKGALNRLINEKLGCNLTENHELLVELIVLWHSQITNNIESRRFAEHLIEQNRQEAF